MTEQVKKVIRTLVEIARRRGLESIKIKIDGNPYTIFIVTSSTITSKSITEALKSKIVSIDK